MDYLGRVKQDEFSSQKLHGEYSVSPQMVPVTLEKKKKKEQKLTSYDRR